MHWTVGDLLTEMRGGTEQSPRRITAFVNGVVDGSVSRPQGAAWLAWAFARGLTTTETVALTRAMTASGDVLTWGEGPLLIDKHSTGGVGDKVSLVLAPLWAELGLRVPMISGRGLGHTGGTLDKLESIPGYRTDLDEGALRRQLDAVGCFITGQTGSLAPADRVLYALRNETSTVESIPLIVGSILSKKLAEGVERLVLDVKVGSGAFMATHDDAVRLARTLVDVACDAGVQCSAKITAMDRPLGRAVGNALEVREAVQALQGGGPDDLVELTVALADHPRAAEVLASGAAFPRFERMVEAQGGDPRALESGLHGSGTTEVVIRASATGHVQRLDARGIGRAAFELGAGRLRAKDNVDSGVGILLHTSLGARVDVGEPLLTLYHRQGRSLERARAWVNEAVTVGESPPSSSPLVLQSVSR